MKIPREAVEKAIEGGWYFNKSHLHRVSGWKEHKHSTGINIWNQLEREELDPKRFLPQQKLLPRVYQFMSYEEVALDPSFWQALGKALGWKDWAYSYYIANSRIDEFNGHWEPVEEFEQIPEHLREVKGAWRRHKVGNPDWQFYSHRFYDLILTGGDTEKFWEELLVGARQ